MDDKHQKEIAENNKHQKKPAVEQIKSKPEFAGKEIEKSRERIIKLEDTAIIKKLDKEVSGTVNFEDKTPNVTKLVPNLEGSNEQSDTKMRNHGNKLENTDKHTKKTSDPEGWKIGLGVGIISTLGLAIFFTFRSEPHVQTEKDAETNLDENKEDLLDSNISK